MEAAFAWKFCLFVLGNTILGSHAALKTIFMEDLCFSSRSRAVLDLKHENVGILMSRPRYDSSKSFKCNVTIVSPKKSSIVLSIYNYDFSPNERLTVEDSDGFTIKIIGSGTFKDEKKSIMSPEKMIVSYTSQNASSSRGFQFTFTQVHNSPCYDNEFSCKNGKCIPKDLACNKHNHCGDNSDQVQCVPVTPRNKNEAELKILKDKSSLPIILLSVLALMLLIITISFIVVIIKFTNSKKPHTTENSESRLTDTGNQLQSIASTIPQQDIQSHTRSNPQVPSDAPQSVTFYNKLRRSIRGRNNNNNRMEEIPVHQETYQVPSMYPNLDPTPSAPEANGVENPNFKTEE